MTVMSFVCRSAHRAFNPHFRAEVKRMKAAMLNHARLLKSNGCVLDKDVYSYFEALQNKGYSQTYIKAILAQASIELQQINQF